MSREAFEAWVKSPPYEHDTSRFPMDEDKYAWPGQYRDITIELAWEAWQAAPASKDEQIRKLREALTRLCTQFPTDDDMAAIGWETHEINSACDAYDRARAALKESA